MPSNYDILLFSVAYEISYFNESFVDFFLLLMPIFEMNDVNLKINTHCGGKNVKMCINSGNLNQIVHKITIIFSSMEFRSSRRERGKNSEKVWIF